MMYINIEITIYWPCTYQCRKWDWHIEFKFKTRMLLSLLHTSSYPTSSQPPARLVSLILVDKQTSDNLTTKSVGRQASDSTP